MHPALMAAVSAAASLALPLSGDLGGPSALVGEQPRTVKEMVEYMINTSVLVVNQDMYGASPLYFTPQELLYGHVSPQSLKSGSNWVMDEASGRLLLSCRGGRNARMTHGGHILPHAHGNGTGARLLHAPRHPARGRHHGDARGANDRTDGSIDRPMPHNKTHTSRPSSSIACERTMQVCKSLLDLMEHRGVRFQTSLRHAVRGMQDNVFVNLRIVEMPERWYKDATMPFPKAFAESAMSEHKVGLQHGMTWHDTTRRTACVRWMAAS